MNGTRSTLVSSIAGFLFAGCLVIGLGAAAAPSARTMPRYSTQYAGSIFLITDNDSNKTYVYVHSGENSELKQVIDLSRAGEPLLRDPAVPMFTANPAE
jgi:hypothetical protein